MNNCKCGKQISKQSSQCKSCSNKNRIITAITKKKISLSHMGHKNPMWKGNEVGYHSLHEWVKKYYKKPKFCEECKIKPPFDLANKTSIYNRDFENWEYLCRKCHMKKDGRIKNLTSYKNAKML